jgi:hypothetical protein
MATNPTPPYKALRESIGLSQRAVERELRWVKRGRLSLIERGLIPTPEEHETLLRFYAERMTKGGPA